MNTFYRLLTTYLLCLAALVLFTPSCIIAQNFMGGVHAGLVGSQVAGDRFSGYNKAGITAGGWVSLQLSTHSVIQMELSYIQKGSRENPDYENERFDAYLMRTGYIELPILYRLLYSNKLNFEAGLAMNVLVQHYEQFNYEELNENPFERINPAILLGLSYNINERLRANIRTNNSLISIRNERVNGDVWRFVDYGQYHDALVLSLYYQL